MNEFCPPFAASITFFNAYNIRLSNYATDICAYAKILALLIISFTGIYIFATTGM